MPADELVERPAVRASRPLLRRALVRSAPLRGRIAEREHDDRSLVGLEAEHLGRSPRLGHPVRGRRDALVPGGEEHVLGRPARVELDRPFPGYRDRDYERCAADVAGREDGLGELLPGARVLDDMEPPRLPVHRAPRDATGLEDPAPYVLGDRPLVVLPDVAPAYDGEERVDAETITTVERPRLIGINHVALEVGNVDEALDFYGGIFVFTLRGRASRMAFIDIGDQFIALAETRTHSPDRHRHFGLVVDDKRRAVAAARQAGADVQGNDVVDPWGNRLQIVDYADVQFTKADAVLRGMGLEGLAKSDRALAELRAKGLA